MAVGFTLMLLDVGFDFIVSRATHSKTVLFTNYFGIVFGLMTVGVILTFASTFLVTRYYKKSQQQRTIAVQGGVPGRIAAEQPVAASSVALTLPFTLRFHANWRYFVFLLILPMVLTLAIGSVVLYFFVFSQMPHLSAKLNTIFFSVFGGFLLLFLVMMGIGFWFAARRLRQYIEISEGGIKGRFLGQENDLYWDEVKLFALWGGKSSTTAALTQLASLLDV